MDKLDRVKRILYLSPMRAAKVQASLRIRAVSPEPSLLAHTSSESILVWFDFCFTALRHILGHFRRGQLT